MLSQNQLNQIFFRQKAVKKKKRSENYTKFHTKSVYQAHARSVNAVMLMHDLHYLDEK